MEMLLSICDTSQSPTVLRVPCAPTRARSQASSPMIGDIIAVIFSLEILVLMTTWLIMALCHVMGW